MLKDTFTYENSLTTFRGDGIGDTATKPITDNQSRGIFAMLKVKIKTKEKCFCGKQFVLTDRGLYCSEHLTSRPDKYFLRFSYRGGKYRLYSHNGVSFHNFADAAKVAMKIDYELERDRQGHGRFDLKKYVSSTHRKSEKNSLEVRFKKWVDLKFKSRKPGYHAKLKQYYEKYYKEQLGTLDIRMIGKDDVQTFYEHMLTQMQERNPEKPLGKKTIKNVMDGLKSFLSDMYTREAITALPKFPKIRPDKALPGYTTREKQLLILNEPSQHDKPIYILLAETGCRPGEARALHKTDIDLKERKITIRHNFSEETLTTTKGGKERTIYMTDWLYETLKKMPVNLKSKYQFTQENGNHYSAWAIDDHWKKARDAAIKKHSLQVIDDLTLYQGTRHTYGVEFVKKNKGNIRTLQKILGHSDIRMTEVYASVCDDAVKEAMLR